MATERFCIKGGDGYSEYWRKDKSPVEVVELAKVLRSIRQISRYVGRNVGKIVWDGMEVDAGLSLDPTFIFGKYPVPSKKVDIAVGMAIQKSYQITEWSDWLKKEIIKALALSPSDQFKLMLFVKSAEKVYIDLISVKNMLSLYTNRYRKWEFRKQRKQMLAAPSVEELLYIWHRRTLHKHGAIDRSFDKLEPIKRPYLKPLALLNVMIDDLKRECPKIPSASDRAAMRLSLYTAVYGKLSTLIRSWPGNSSDPFFFGESTDDSTACEFPKNKTATTKIKEYKREIEKTIQKGRADYTGDVKAIVANREEVVPIKDNNVVALAEEKADKKIIHNLKVVFQSVARRKTRFNRGLVTGKIDRRRLYRARTTGTVFLLRKDCFELKNNFILLVDCTGSMADPGKWENTQTIYQSLFQAIKGFNKTARLFGYNEVNGACQFTELYRNGQLYSIHPNGRTASGEAILATVLKLKKNHKRPFIVHITDGASNWGCGVDQAVKYCEQKKVNLLTLGIACSPDNRRALKDEYGNKVAFVENEHALAGLMKRLLQSSRYH